MYDTFVLQEDITTDGQEIKSDVISVRSEYLSDMTTKKKDW